MENQISRRIGNVGMGIAWFNHQRLLETIGYIPPAEAEKNYYQQQNKHLSKTMCLVPRYSVCYRAWLQMARTTPTFRELAYHLYSNKSMGKEWCAAKSFWAVLQQQQIICIKIEAVSMDSISIKVHPDSTGTLSEKIVCL